MNGRNIRQCHDRWVYYLSPRVCNDPWAQEDDEKLIRLAQELNGKWVQIAKRFKGRNDTQIKNRWNTLRKTKDLPEIRKKKVPTANDQNRTPIIDSSKYEGQNQCDMINSILDNFTNRASNEESFDPFNTIDNGFWC